MPDWITQTATILGSIGAGSWFTAWLKARQENRTAADRNTRTQRRDIIAEYDGLLEQLKGDVTGLRSRMDDLEKELDEVRGVNRALTKANAALHATVLQLKAIMRTAGMGHLIPDDVTDDLAA